MGGNRWTAYNWETNASNAGSDWYYSNDNYLGGGNAPGEAVRGTIQAAHNAGASALVTIPIAGYVSADKDGPVDLSDPNHLSERFHVSLPEKGSALLLTPNTGDDYVYQDEFVNWLINEFPGSDTDTQHALFYMLDNEPALWASTHEEIHPVPVTYAELATRSKDYAIAIKSVVPQATVFGFVGYGWNAFVNLQGASDSGTYGDFINYYLAQMSQAESDEGYRLMDVLDLHWYPEAQGNGVRITEDDNSAAVVAARVQAPRSLWDPAYTETSWITQWSTGGPIKLIPRIKEQIAANYPGTKLSISEYNYGGCGHISGGIAQADALGIFGREDIFEASLWPFDCDQTFQYAAFNMYRNFDGSGANFGDTSIPATTPDLENTSIYASVDAGNPNRMVLVAINKSSQTINGQFTITSTTDFSTARAFELTSSIADPQSAGTVSVSANTFNYALKPMSVTTLELTH